MFAYLFLWFISMLASLDACIVAFPPWDWLGVITCEIHPHGVSVLDTHLSLFRAMLIQTYICPPRTPSFCLITCLFALSYASNVCLPLFDIFSQLVFSMLFPSIFFSVYLLTCFFCLCMYTHGARSLGARVRRPRSKEKGNNVSKKMYAYQGVVQ